MMQFNNGFNGGSVAWQIHDHEIEKATRIDRWCDRMFHNLEVFIEFCERMAKRNAHR